MTNVMCVGFLFFKTYGSRESGVRKVEQGGEWWEMLKNMWTSGTHHNDVCE